jgi:hypothetical protein
MQKKHCSIFLKKTQFNNDVASLGDEGIAKERTDCFYFYIYLLQSLLEMLGVNYELFLQSSNFVYST